MPGDYDNSSVSGVWVPSLGKCLRMSVRKILCLGEQILLQERNLRKIFHILTFEDRTKILTICIICIKICISSKNVLVSQSHKGRLSAKLILGWILPRSGLCLDLSFKCLWLL